MDVSLYSTKINVVPVQFRYVGYTNVLTSTITKMAAQKAAQKASQALQALKPYVRTFFKYARVELAPPNPLEIKQLIVDIGTAVKGVGSIGNWTVKEAFVNTLVGIEIGCWFFVGECIGKRHFVGYKV